MRHRVTLQSRTAATSAIGEETYTYTAVATDIPAMVEQVHETEQMRAGQMTPRGIFRLGMRHRTDVDHDSRFVWDGRTLEVKGPAREDMKKRWVVVTAEEVI